MPLTSREKIRVKQHLGYPLTATAPSIQFGLARPLQTMFLVDDAVNLIQDEALDIVRGLLQKLDDIDNTIIEARDRLAAFKLDDLELRGSKAGETEPDLLEREYARQAYRLADLLGCPIYPHAARFKSSNGAAGCIPVVG